MDNLIHSSAHQSKHSATRPHDFFCHLLSLVRLLVLCSFESPLADLHPVSPITEEYLITTPPPSSLPHAGILAPLSGQAV